MKQIVRFRAPLVILTSVFCTYGALHADAACCGTKRKQECETPTAENAKKFKKAPMEQKIKTATGLEYTILTPSEETITPKPAQK